MRVLVVFQGQWGERILDHLAQTAPPEWEVASWKGAVAYPPVIDDPDEFLPDHLPKCDLLLVLTEHAGMADLTPDLAQRSEAQGVILPIDRRSWAPSGLVRQVESRLRDAGIDLATPMPFCSLSPTSRQHWAIRAFAERYGRPRFACEAQEGKLVSCGVLRGAPCGNTRYIARHLAGVAVEKGAEQAGLLHHYYPCWGGMEADPVTGEHTLLHIAATLSQRAAKRALDHAREDKE
jgi:hypothetical protein